MLFKEPLDRVKMFFVTICLTVLICSNIAVTTKVTDEEYALMPELFHLDNFDNCMKLGKEALYCTISVQLSPHDLQNKSVVWNIIQDVIDYPKNYRHDILRHGICVPKTCPGVALDQNNVEELKHGIGSCYMSKYDGLGLKAIVTEIQCETDQPYYPIDNFDKAVVILFGVIFFVVMVGTFYEGLARYQPKDEYQRIVNTGVGRILACFSIPKNWYRLRQSKEETNVEAFRSMNGVRFYNTQLVIMTHVSMILLASPIMNPKFVEAMTDQPENMLFLNGACAIQTFLLITGYIVSYKFLLLFEKHKELQIRKLILAFVNRYLRLTPCLMVVMAFNASWLYHFARGPMWNRLVGVEYINCRRNWWANLLYINNVYNLENVCMQHTWYLAADTQMFLMSLVVVGFMWKYQHRIKLILGISIAIGVTMPVIINYYYDMDIVVRQYPETFYNLFLNSPEWKTMYASSLTNFGGYAIGMTFGYLAYINAKQNKKVFTNKIYVAIWWVLVWGPTLGVIFYGILIYQDDYQYTRLGAALYVSLHKNLFALGLSFTVYGAAEGIGWFLRDCILWPPLQVLGRLTYCTYLVHVAVIRVRGGQLSSPLYISNFWIFVQTVGDAVTSYIVATLLALFVELPVSALQKIMIAHLEGEGVTETAGNKSDYDSKERTNKKQK